MPGDNGDCYYTCPCHLFRNEEYRGFRHTSTNTSGRQKKIDRLSLYANALDTNGMAVNEQTKIIFYYARFFLIFHLKKLFIIIGIIAIVVVILVIIVAIAFGRK
jgi:hypothetical protein